MLLGANVAEFAKSALRSVEHLSAHFEHLVTALREFAVALAFGELK